MVGNSHLLLLRTFSKWFVTSWFPSQSFPDLTALNQSVGFFGCEGAAVGDCNTWKRKREHSYHRKATTSNIKKQITSNQIKLLSFTIERSNSHGQTFIIVPKEWTLCSSDFYVSCVGIQILELEHSSWWRPVAAQGNGPFWEGKQQTTWWPFLDVVML